VLNKIVEIAKKAGCKTVTGEYLPTPKNGMVKDHFTKLNFIAEGNLFILHLANYINLSTLIKEL